jgi:hypothetical protein
MPTASDVGRSDRRTPVKHQYLSATVGTDIGSARYCARKLRVPYWRHVFVDLTAGDGIAYYGEDAWRTACSPGIFAHHGRYESCPVPVQILLQERAPAVFEKLAASLTAELPLLGYRQVDDLRWEARGGRVVLEAQHGDSRDLPCPWGRGDFVFLSNDPNKVHEWALPQALRAAVDRGAVVRSFSTMGCNPGGLKRLEFQGGRDGWYGHVGSVIEALRSTQDVTLIAIDRDDAQWAYLVVTPTRWRDDDVARARRVFEKHGMTVTATAWRSEPQQFRQLLDLLFRTAKERRAETDEQL